MGVPSKEEIAVQVECARNRAKIRCLADQDTCTIVALADDVERLRKTWNIKRCAKLSTDDPARRCRLAEDHEVDCDFGEMERLRSEVERLHDYWRGEMIARGECLLELERLRAERAEVLALLESIDDDLLMAIDDGDDPGECCAWLPDKECLGHRRMALVAKLRGAP